ncbi:hypothetical protein OCF84_20570 (plasmid) [Shewanella xiamenensis]|uniref:Uncharacterized protein n=1 Tax=Shewanella xiamenensis TaxID=332186 RepID=A0ABT6UII9_9GAMM|nr:hypothetical protein [Shewanella xiamenensis]MDI5833336.1 hypothetical protein [Shewanella xiamenensis]WHF57912.1 hypothetical protein OCF84_20570 [Shewanella xiamenensis]
MNTKTLLTQQSGNEGVRLTTVQPIRSFASTSDVVVDKQTKSFDDKLAFKNKLGVSCPNLIPVESMRDFEELFKIHIREFTAKHGLSFSELESVISNDQREARLTVSISSLNFYGMDTLATCYIKMAHEYGLKPEWFGQKFTIGTATNLVITGMDINEVTKVARIRVFNGSAAVFVRENSFDRLRAAFK